MEGRAPQSMIASTMNMTEIIFVYVDMHLEELVLPQTELLHPEADAWSKHLRELAGMALEINRGKGKIAND